MGLFFLVILFDSVSTEGGPPLTPGNGKIQFFFRKKRNR